MILRDLYVLQSLEVERVVSVVAHYMYALRSIRSSQTPPKTRRDFCNSRRLQHLHPSQETHRNISDTTNYLDRFDRMTGAIKIL